LVEVFRVDVILPIGTSDAVQSFAKRFPYLIKPFIYDQVFIDDGEGGARSQVLDIHNALVNLHETPEWKGLVPFICSPAKPAKGSAPRAAKRSTIGTRWLPAPTLPAQDSPQCSSGSSRTPAHAAPSGHSSSCQKGLPVNANIVLARLAVMSFSDFVSLGNVTAGSASK
jgi:hypothetical protein